METRIKKNCPNCSQYYQLTSLSSNKHGNIPLFLSCGHSMCENCIRNIVKFAEPLECKVCYKEVEVNNLTLLKQNKVTLYSCFPVNVYMLGELALQLIQTKDENKDKENEPYVDVKSIMQNKSTEGKCLECHGPTTKMCQQCGIIVCNTCFNKSHKNFIIFKNHVLQNIEIIHEQATCIMHKDKPLGYYCKDCEKAICMDCLMVGGEKSCKNHNAVSIQEVNEDFLAELGEISPKINEMLKRFSKTAVDIGNILTNIENETIPSQTTALVSDIEQHFSQLTAVIQKQKDELIAKVLKLKCTEEESLLSARNVISEALKKGKKTLDTIKSIDPKNLQQLNLAKTMEDSKEVLEKPWYLKQDTPEEPLTINVNEDLLNSLNNFVSLEGNEISGYKLYSTKELIEQKIDIPPPPQSIIYPPDMVKDVRQLKKPPIVEKEMAPKNTAMLIKNIPTYRSKSGSCSSLNSTHSDSSDMSYSHHRHHTRMPVEQVPPFPESRHPKQLCEGDQELIYISHIVDPHNFFVQRACHQSKVEELLREFRNAATKSKPTLSHVGEGKVYLVFNKADNLWQRCRVVSIDRKDANKPIFQVFCIDFGSTEFVTIDKLRLLPPARIQSPEPLAISCCLANCEPISGSWTSDDALLIQNIINNKQAVLHVRQLRMSKAGVHVLCDVVTVESGISIAHALAFHARARLPLNLPPPKMPGIMENPKIFTGNYDVKPNSVEEVYITHVVSPDSFYVRKKYVQSIYEKLSENLELEYNFDNGNGTIYLPERGMVCVVNLERSGLELGWRWARGQVLELPGRARVRVLLLDVGATLLVHCSALRYIHHKFTAQRALAIECHLAGVTPLNKKWNPGSVQLLQTFIGRELEMQVEDKRNRGSVGVILYDKSNEEDVICVNQQMIKFKFAVTFGMYKFNTSTETEELVITNKSPLEPKQKPKMDNKKSDIKILQKPVERQSSEETDLDAIDKGPIRLEAKILNYQSPSLLYVSLVHQQKVFNELYENIQKYYSKKKTQQKEDWKVEDRCCTVCHQSQTWRRAAILEINGDSAKVFYSDFACIETVPLSSLREIPADFTSIGDAAIMCHLCGVMPAFGEEWPLVTKEYLKDLLDAYPRIFITKNGQFKGKSMPVELWVYHTIQGGALEANKSEWRCLNKKIIEQGLGIPDPDTKADSEKTEDNLFLNLKGSIQDYLQVELQPLKPLKVKSESETNSRSSPGSESLEECGEPKPNTVFISDWLPPEPLPDTEFTAIPTYIDNDGVIYLHEVSQRDTLDLIRQALDVRFQNPDPKAKFTKWHVGEPCIALYFLDNKFYRGRVLEVNEETSTCLIQYIDYGNEEHCSFINLRKSIALHQIPIQAHKCTFNRIEPIGKNWKRKALDYIHKSIVEKECYVKVAGEPKGDIFPIELKYNKLWINDHLVEFELAKYSDGSQAIIQKFAPTSREVRRSHNNEESFTHESDSGPDFIVETEDTGLSDYNPFDIKDLEGKDWNEIVNEEDNKLTGKFITFSNSIDNKFKCDITIINEMSKLELSVVQDEETAALYESMYTELQSKGHEMPALNGIFENKACLALFPDDGKWYRAIILEYSEAKGKIKVKYVDYGNVEIISLADVREISEDYTKLSPATVTATLHGVKVNPNIDVKLMYESFTETFLDKGPFNAEVITFEEMVPSVELKDDEGRFVYQALIDCEFFINSQN